MKIVEQFSYENIQGFKFGYQAFGRPKMFSLIYFVDGLLIDSGHRKVQKDVLAQLGNLDVQQMFITHHHEDHTGNVDVLQKHFNCSAYASSLCAEMMKTPPGLSPIQKMVWGKRPAMPGLLAEDQQICTENYVFDIIPIPGHAPDMVALHEARQGWLFSSDLYVHSYIGYFIETESIIQQINSIQRILKLQFGPMFCGHNPQFENGREKLGQKLSFLREFYEQVTNLYAQGKSAREIFHHLKLKEKGSIKWLSGGYLSKMNMVKSAIRDWEAEKQSRAGDVA
ncbi:MBL fold metallo-hydrolase [Porifericola rhodea]|uniref:MBL fold metallo-hydrolase n=1 Tax=Porifericola rhodea TaxID=930972 RepID=UPI0026653F25|nr:MBL fold metallo-hydrolase [Porifericola rhodea]WKN30348.1 MBL fold metallo-hydrolase [Porifericola rhodea]